MEKFYRYSMQFCCAFVFVWVICIVAYMAIGWAWAAVISVALMAGILFFLYKNPLEMKELRISLLFDVFIICVGVGFAIQFQGKIQILPVGVACCLMGVLDAIYWFSINRNSGKSFRTIIKEEFRFPAELDMVMIVLWIYDSVMEKDFGKPLEWLFVAFLVFDYIRQKKDRIVGLFRESAPKDIHTLKNDVLTVRIKEHGAELASIKKGSMEYLWQADPAFWGRHSPVLFPIVGSVWDKKYRVGEREFELGQHGFARDMDFIVISASDTEVRYCLTSKEDTLKKYPWRFALEIAYRLHGNKIDVIWEVKNIDDEDMYFQIGAHPAFNYPDYDPGTEERGYLSFDRQEGLECIRIKEKGCVDAETKYPLEVPQNGLVPVTRETFDTIDTIMLQDSQIGKVTLHRKDGTPWLALSFDAPVVGIWSPPAKNAPFICLEPWYGRCDRVGYTGDYREKDWINRLSPGEKFSSVYTIEIF